MNEKQQIAEAERRFENWWEAEGKYKKLRSREDETTPQFIQRVTKEAWMNGAFVARENN